LDNWKNDHYGRIALIILGDSLAQVMFKGTPKQYDTILYALGVA